MSARQNLPVLRKGPIFETDWGSRLQAENPVFRVILNPDGVEFAEPIP